MSAKELKMIEEFVATKTVEVLPDSYGYYEGWYAN